MSNNVSISRAWFESLGAALEEAERAMTFDEMRDRAKQLDAHNYGDTSQDWRIVRAVTTLGILARRPQP